MKISDSFSDKNGNSTGSTDMPAEITRHKKVEEAIKLSNNYNRSLIEASLDPLVIIGHKGKINDVNELAEQITGYSRNDLIGTDFSDYFTEPEEVRKCHHQVCTYGKVSNYHLEIQHKDGYITPVMYSASAHRNEDGEVICIFAIARDITERKKAEEALQKSETKYCQMVETAQEGTWLIDNSDQTLFVNQKMSEMLGYSIEEIMESSPRKFMSPEFSAKAVDRLHEHMQGVKHVVDCKFIRKDGSDLWCILSSCPLFGDEGKYAGSLAMFTDITERKKAEETLKKAYENLEKLVEARTVQLEKAYKSLKESRESLAEAQRIAHIGNWEWDPATNKAYWSEEMYRIFGLNPQEPAPNFNEFLNYIHPEDRGCIDKIINKREEGVFDGIDYRIITAKSEERTVYTQSEAIFSEKNIPIRVRGIVQDITERKKSEENRLESEEKYRNIVETANEGIVIIDDKARITFANHKMAEMFGYDVGDGIGRSLWDYMSNETRAVVEKNMEKWVYGIIETYEIELRCKDGSSLWALVNSKPLFNENGKGIGILAMLTDVTERKKAEEKLRKSEEKYRNIIETTNEGIVVIDSGLRITYVNQKLMEKGGYLPEEVIGRQWWDFTDEEGKVVAKQHMDKRRQGIDETYELRLMRKDGSPFWVLVSSKSLHDKDGRFSGSLSMLTDITERKKAEEKVKSLAKIVESSNDAIITESLDGGIVSWNKGAEQVYGYLADEVLGKNVSILEPDNRIGEIKQLTNEITQGKKVQRYETSQLKKDGTTINVSLTLSPILDQSGKIIAISCIAGDITEKKITEKLLQEKQMAEVANRTKNDFLASISHELRTPLNSIIGFSDILYEQAYGELNEKQTNCVGNISQSGKHLLNLINNILDISKIEAGKMELVYKNFELAAKLSMIRNILYPIASKKNIKIEIDMDGKLTNICADEDKFVQIMYNFVDNAIKFSYIDSLIKIGARKKGDMVEITVKDTGIGIKTEDQKKLFKPFSQIYSFSPRKSQGTGLGLSLAKKIVHLHGGY
ncbi:MAG TPA: PAS domain S-box protein, partial [Methanosarcina sp.]|nr:PAS domain S-box protein [Methanosarcina sp.]